MPKIKQLVEDAINECFGGETKESMLEFVAHMRQKRMSPVQSFTNSWICRHKENVVCRFNLDGNVMRIAPIVDEHDGNSLSDKMKETVWANAKSRPCGDSCHVLLGDGYDCGYSAKTLFGKELNDFCANSIVFINPNANDVECLKMLIELRVETIHAKNLRYGKPR